MKENPVGVLNPKNNMIVAEHPSSAFAVFDEFSLGELQNGVLGLFSLAEPRKAEPIAQLTLPAGSLGKSPGIRCVPGLQAGSARARDPFRHLGIGQQKASHAAPRFSKEPGSRTTVISTLIFPRTRAPSALWCGPTSGNSESSRRNPWSRIRPPSPRRRWGSGRRRHAPMVRPAEWPLPRYSTPQGLYRPIWECHAGSGRYPYPVGPMDPLNPTADGPDVSGENRSF